MKGAALAAIAGGVVVLAVVALVATGSNASKAVEIKEGEKWRFTVEIQPAPDPAIADAVVQSLGTFGGTVESHSLTSAGMSITYTRVQLLGDHSLQVPSTVSFQVPGAAPVIGQIVRAQRV